MPEGTKGRLRAARARAIAMLDQLRPLALLLLRLSVGVVFMSTGWGKVHNLAKVTEYFATTLHIPAPGLNAALAGYSELVCGSLLILGLFSRLATIPLLVTMVVAILTAKYEELHNVFDLFGFVEFTYLLILAAIALLGPGKWALDHWLARKIEES